MLLLLSRARPTLRLANALRVAMPRRMTLRPLALVPARRFSMEQSTGNSTANTTATTTTAGAASKESMFIPKEEQQRAPRARTRPQLPNHQAESVEIWDALSTPNPTVALGEVLGRIEAEVASGARLRSAIPYNVALDCLKQMRIDAFSQRNALIQDVGAAHGVDLRAGGTHAARAELERATKSVAGAMSAMDFAMLVIEVWDRLRAPTPPTGASAPLPGDPPEVKRVQPDVSIVTNVSQRVLLLALARARGRDWMRDGVSRFQATISRRSADSETRRLTPQELAALTDFMEWLRRQIVAVRLEVMAAHNARGFNWKGKRDGAVRSGAKTKKPSPNSPPTGQAF